MFDATGAPDAIRAGSRRRSPPAALMIVGMSHHDVPLRVFGFVDKELDVLGVSCCQGDEFAEAVAFVERNGDELERLITQEFPLERAPEALRWAMEHPAEAMKVVIGDHQLGGCFGRAPDAHAQRQGPEGPRLDLRHVRPRRGRASLGDASWACRRRS